MTAIARLAKKKTDFGYKAVVLIFFDQLSTVTCIL